MKILVVFTGGTIGSDENNGVISPDSACSYALLNMYSANRGNVENVEFETARPYTILSENLCADRLNSLYDCINSYDISAFDGVIVTHGTDTLQYTAAYLGLVFAGSRTPIVLVSANYPLGDKRSNGLVNFTAAVDFICSGSGTGAFAAYCNKGENPKIHRAEKLLAHAAYSDELHSIFDEYYGEIADGKFIKKRCDAASFPDCFQAVSYKSCKGTLHEPAPSLPKKLARHSDIIFLRLYVSPVYPQITPQTKAVLLEGWHSGTLPTADVQFREFCRQAAELGVPVFLTGAQDGFFYESKLMFDELKIRVLEPMPPIAAYMKLWLQFSNGEKENKQ